MTYSEDDVRRMHLALYKGCGLSAPTFSVRDMRMWHDFLSDLKSLEETPGGAFTISDLVAVIGTMRKQKEKGAKWSMRPINILRDPELFRDLVLEARKSLAHKVRYAERAAAVRPAEQHLPNGINRRLDTDEVPENYATASAAALAELAEFRRKQKLQHD